MERQVDGIKEGFGKRGAKGQSYTGTKVFNSMKEAALSQFTLRRVKGRGF